MVDMGFGFDFEDDYWTATNRDEKDREYVESVLENIKYKGITLEGSVKDLFLVLGIPDSQVAMSAFAEVILEYVKGRESKEETVKKILGYGKW